MTHKITILWIEDNPKAGGLNIDDLRIQNPDLANLLPVDYNGEIPGISFSNNPTPTNYGIDSPRDMEEYAKYFDLSILQNVEEIKEYHSLCLEIEDKIGPRGIGQCKKALPEIVVFDYKLRDGFNDNAGGIKYNDEEKVLREFYNPNFELIQSNQSIFKDRQPFFENEENLNYNESDFLYSINQIKDVSESFDFSKDEMFLKDDEMGLYAGVTIVRNFREHTCVGIPATANKGDISSLTGQSKYFEWLNGYDLGSMFSRKSRDSKDWKVIIINAVEQLRNRIITQVATGKIQLDLNQLSVLSDISKTVKPKDEGARKFTFTSIYGTRHLPLDGLFIDKDAGKERVDAIEKWVNDLINEWSSRVGVKFEEYKKAVDISRNLLRAYRQDRVEKRHTLSELITKKINDNLKTPGDTKTLIELMDFFGINENHIEGIKNKESKFNKISKNQTDIKTETKSEKRSEVKRLVVLFTDLRLHFQYQEFMMKVKKNMDDVNELTYYLFERPKFEDLYVALFPVPESPLVLPYHQIYLPPSLRSKDPFDIWFQYLKDITVGGKSYYPENLTNAEVKICLNFASELTLQKEFYPYWLINK
jgi:hypothetical protein